MGRERLRDLEADRHAAARQGDHQWLLVAEALQHLGETTPRLFAIHEKGETIGH